MIVLAVDLSASRIGWARWNRATGKVDFGRMPEQRRADPGKPAST